MIAEKNNFSGSGFNTGEGARFECVDIGHKDCVLVVNADTAFWLLVRKDELGSFICGDKLREIFSERKADFKKDIDYLRFGLKPSAVYFNPTERCNMNCRYCYIPEAMRREGVQMSPVEMFKAMETLRDYFSRTVEGDVIPQIIFHGAEPMLNKEAMFEVVKRFGDNFIFGIQTNATLLEDTDIDFIKEHGVNLGISIDGPDAATADGLRRDWSGKGHFSSVIRALERFRDYEHFSVICTVSTENLKSLAATVEFLHSNGVGTCLINMMRCTQETSRGVKPDEDEAAKFFIEALERSDELYRKSGRKLVVGNFANILRAILAPTSRQLMCDVSPCGGGRCFFALAADGSLFPCSEFVGLPEFRGGNIFHDRIEAVLETEQFRNVSERLVENIEYCSDCAIRHFCGAPCPAEAYTMNGGINRRGAFCRFYEEQAKYAFRLIADGRAGDFLPDNWDSGMKTMFRYRELVEEKLTV